MHRLLVYLGAHLIDDNDRESPVMNPRIVTQASRDVFAVLDCPDGRRKLQSFSVSDRYAVLHIKIENSHQVACRRWT
jgi:hypothetical protein